MNIIPKPQKIKILEGFFDVVIIEKVNYDAFLDERIFKELKKINICIKKVSDLDAPLILEKSEQLKNEQYQILITNKQIKIIAKTTVGAFYGIKTLQQIMKEESIPCLEIDDYPDLELRGVMLDISRSKVPTLATLKKLIDKFALLKYNHVELYVEGFSFEYNSFRKEIEINNNYLPLEDFKELETYCNDNFIDLVPNQNGFGHMADWLALDEYKHLAECPDGFYIWGAHRPPSTLDPSNPGSEALVKMMYDDMLPHFKSDYFNMCFDEPFELGHGKSKELVEKIGEGTVFINFFKKLSDYVKEVYHKTPMLWGDVLIKHPESIKDLPKDVIFIDWGYNHLYDFDKHAKILKDSQVDFVLAPGTVSWGNILGNFLDMEGSIAHAADAAKKYGAKGLMVTDWGDIGHLQYVSASYPGFVYSAIKSWSDGDEQDIVNGVSLLVDDLELAKIIVDLSKFIPLEGPYRDYGCRLFYPILWAEHASRYEKPLDYFLEKMQHVLIPEENIEGLRRFFDEFLLKLEENENVLEVQELKNSIFLLKTLLDINVKFTIIYNNQKEDEIDFQNEISLLNVYSTNHLKLWNMRNIHDGYKMSNQRILWLIQVLALVKQERS